ncbi:hypothetical protein [Cupriavidus sp. USMAA2-4]|nr:hypothetical protein [Cupriavidus sp. USMAA2-4]
MTTVERYMAGISITGERIGLDLHPDMEPGGAGAGAVRIIATGAPEATALDCWSALGHAESRGTFGPQEIRLAGDELLCMAARVPGVPQYREGFSLALEPGMAQALGQWLPRLQGASALAKAVLARLAERSGREAWPQEAELVAEVVSRRVLDRLAVDDAFAMATDAEGERYFPRREAMYEALHDALVLQWLEQALAPQDAAAQAAA